MIETFLTFVLGQWGIMTILYKYNIQKILADYAKKREWKFLHSLSGCQFCIEHHVGVLMVTACALLSWTFQWEFILVPFLATSLMSMIKFLGR